MADERLTAWQALFCRAMVIIDGMQTPLPEWSFGGGTVLMLHYRHRFSRDIDIFIPDVQYLTHLTPRLNEHVEILTGDYVESAKALKLRFEEGEIDFVASAPLTDRPYRTEIVLGRSVRVETATEIVAKKVWHRGDVFTGRDIFDLATVAELDRASLVSIEPVLEARRSAILDRIERHGDALREAFEQLDMLTFDRTFDDCVGIVRRLLGRPTFVIPSNTRATRGCATARPAGARTRPG